jgi:GTPase SAR1 family protein
MTGKRAVGLSLWDTAWQEKYQAIVPMFLRDAHAVTAVFDLTSRDSFDLIKSWVTEEARTWRGSPSL